jgi:hypothetical protein
VLNKPLGNIDVDLAPGYEAVALPLAPLRPLLKPIVYRSREEICSTLAEAARSNDLPVSFFIRLLDQESSFRPHAISAAGALGMAQFMPETAADGVSIIRSIRCKRTGVGAPVTRFVPEVRKSGPRPAAYNGSKRVEDWLARRAKLPQETQNYVKTITGWPAETWTVTQAGAPAVKLPRHASCQEAAGLLAWNGPDQIPLPPQKPRAKDLLDHERVGRQSPGGNNRISDRRPAVGSASTTADQSKLLMNVQGNKTYQCELYGISKFCTLR